MAAIIAVSCNSNHENPFWGDGTEFFEVQEIFPDERFPNVVVSTNGTVIATWGRFSYQIRRSENGGSSWGPIITVADPGFHGGGALVDEHSGDILVFVEAHHPPAPLQIYRSTDHGLTWTPEESVIHADENGSIPSMHMNERGITLNSEPHSGRLIRPARSYGQGNNREFWDQLNLVGSSYHQA